MGSRGVENALLLVLVVAVVVIVAVGGAAVVGQAATEIRNALP